MNWEKIWKFLNTPPPKPEIPALENFINQVDASFSKWIAEQIINFTKLLDQFLLSTPISLLESKAFHMVYLVSTGIALAGITPMVAVVGFKAMMGKMDGEEALKSLGRLALIPIGTFLAPGLIISFLKVMNALARILVYATPNINAKDNLFPAGLELGVLVFTVIYLVLVVRLLLYYCYRNYGLLFLVASFPVILLTYATGHIEKIRRWTKEMTALMLTQVIHAFQLLLLVVMTMIVGSGAEPGIPTICFQIGALLYMNKTPQWLADYIHEAPDPIAAAVKLKNSLDPTKLMRRLSSLGIKSKNR
jgi:hypothetical protein